MQILMLAVNLILITVIIDRAHLELPDNETKVALRCYFFDADIYEGDDYYI